MIEMGFVKPGSTIRIPFSSFDKDDGSSITMTNYAVADILIFKDGSTTERASTAGFTATTDFDTKTGKHLAVIDLADNTTAGFYSAGSEYLVAIDAVTVDAVTTGGWIARFTIGQPAAILNTTIATLASQTSFTLTAGPAEDDALNGMWAVIHDVASAVQQSWVQILDYTGSTKTVTLVAGATFTAAATDNISIMFPQPLMPTTTGRTLDVSAGGEAGLDWNNVGTPGATVGLSATTVATVTTTTTATNVTTVNGLAANVITAAATAADFSTEVNTAVLAVLGALNDAAADGAVTTTDTMVAYLKQIINTLEGAPGLPTWPAAAAPANGVSIAEALRYLYDQVGVAGAGLTAADDAVITVIGANGAGLTALATQASVNTIDDFLDTEIASIISTLGAPAGVSVSADIAAVKAQTAAIETDTAEIGAAGAGLTNINLPNQTMDIVGNITGNLSGSVGSVTGAVGSVTGSVGSLAAQAKADVNAEVVDALATDTYAEPGQGAPAATTTLAVKLGYVYKAFRNKVTQTSTEYKLFGDDAATVDQKATVSDDGVTFTRGEVGTGA